MALSASTVFEIQSTATASNANGGGFNPANANMLTDLTATGGNTSAPVVSSASYNFAAGDVGHWLYIKSGTNWISGWYKIQSVAANAATLEASVGSVNVSQVVNNRYGSNTVIGCAAVASPTGGTFTIDYSQGTTAILALSNFASTAGTAVLTTATGGSFTPVMAGNLLRLASGTHVTAGWYEIVSYTSGTSVTLDRACDDGTNVSSGVGKVGGALSLGSSDDAVFELAVSSATSAARFFIKSGTYTIGGTVTISAAGNTAWPCVIEGYASMRGDRPSGSTRPVFACGAAAFTLGNAWSAHSLQITTTASSGLITGANSKVRNCKITNTSTTAGRSALVLQTTSTATACEAVSYRGVALLASTSIVIGCYLHDSDIGISLGTSSLTAINNIICGNVTAAVSITGANVAQKQFIGNTLYGAENKVGSGITQVTGSTLCTVINNIIYGFSTGISHADVQTTILDDYNNYYNNTNDVNASANWQKGANDLALDPRFANVAQITGTTATTSNTGNTLVHTGKTFITSGVVAGRDFVYISNGGAGATAGKYGIVSVDSETQLTLDLAPGNSTGDVSYQITTGRNFAIGTNLRAAGFPGAYPAGLTTGYTDVGAVQRCEPNYSFTFAG